MDVPRDGDFEDLEWQVSVYWFYSNVYFEKIEVAVQNEGDTVKFNDEDLRQSSYRVSPDSTTSETHILLSSQSRKVVVYALNNLPVNTPTFKVLLREHQSKKSVVSIIYTVLSSVFTLVLCCICILGCVRCLQKDQDINYDVDEVNPEWDPQQIRYFQMRALERRVA